MSYSLTKYYNMMIRMGGLSSIKNAVSKPFDPSNKKHTSLISVICRNTYTEDNGKSFAKVYKEIWGGAPSTKEYEIFKKVSLRKLRCSFCETRKGKVLFSNKTKKIIKQRFPRSNLISIFPGNKINELKVRIKINGRMRKVKSVVTRGIVSLYFDE